MVFDAGQNSEANFTRLAATGMHYIGWVPASDCPDLTALPASRRSIVDAGRFGGLTAHDTRRVVYGAERRAILTHSPELHQSQAAGFGGTTLARPARSSTSWPPPWPAARPATGKGRSGDRGGQPSARHVITWQLDGDRPKDLRWPRPSTRPPARAGRGNRGRRAHRSR